MAICMNTHSVIIQQMTAKEFQTNASALSTKKQCVTMDTYCSKRLSGKIVWKLIANRYMLLFQLDAFGCSIFNKNAEKYLIPPTHNPKNIRFWTINHFVCLPTLPFDCIFCRFVQISNVCNSMRCTRQTNECETIAERHC